jgi:hypothetical protein
VTLALLMMLNKVTGGWEGSKAAGGEHIGHRSFLVFPTDFLLRNGRRQNEQVSMASIIHEHPDIPLTIVQNA